jgi:hypothetical protein
MRLDIIKNYAEWSETRYDVSNIETSIKNYAEWRNALYNLANVDPATTIFQVKNVPGE